VKDQKRKGVPEALALSQNKRFWKMFDEAYERGEKEGWIALHDLD
jgi:hypothetical protein